jgi:hypothetical protein
MGWWTPDDPSEPKELSLSTPGLDRLRKNSLNEGHGFSRAVKSHSYEGFSP